MAWHRTACTGSRELAGAPQAASTPTVCSMAHPRARGLRGCRRASQRQHGRGATGAAWAARRMPPAHPSACCPCRTRSRGSRPPPARASPPTGCQAPKGAAAPAGGRSAGGRRVQGGAGRLGGWGLWCGSCDGSHQGSRCKRHGKVLPAHAGLLLVAPCCHHTGSAMLPRSGQSQAMTTHSQQQRTRATRANRAMPALLKDCPSRCMRVRSCEKEEGQATPRSAPAATAAAAAAAAHLCRLCCGLLHAAHCQPPPACRWGSRRASLEAAVHRRRPGVA